MLQDHLDLRALREEVQACTRADLGRAFPDRSEGGVLGCMNGSGNISTFFRPIMDPMQYFREQFR